MKVVLVLSLLHFCFSSVVLIEKVVDLEGLKSKNTKFALLVKAKNCERSEKAMISFKQYAEKASFPFFVVMDEVYEKAMIAGKPTIFPHFVYGFETNVVSFSAPSYLTLFLSRITASYSKFSKKQGDSLIFFTPTAKSKEIFSQISSLVSPLFDNIMYIDSETDSILSLDANAAVITIDSASSISYLKLPISKLNSNQLSSYYNRAQLALKSALNRTYVSYSSRSLFHTSLFESYLVFSPSKPYFKPVFDSLAEDYLNSNSKPLIMQYNCDSDLKIDCSKPSITLFSPSKAVSSYEEGRFNMQTIDTLLGNYPKTPTVIPSKPKEEEAPRYRYLIYFLAYTTVFFFVYRAYSKRNTSDPFV